MAASIAPAPASAYFGFKDEFPLAPTPSAPGRSAPYVADLAVDPTSRSIYVTYGAQVQKYEPAGRLIRAWGSYGTAPGQFGGTHPVGIAGQLAVGSDGSVFVTDPYSDRTQRFTRDGALLAIFPRNGAPAGVKPKYGGIGSIAADRAGNLFAADSRGLRRLSLDGQLRVQREAFPGYLAHQAGKLFMTLPGHTSAIVTFGAASLAGLSQLSSGGPGQGLGGEEPGDLSADPRGLWISSRVTRQIYRSSLSGAFVTSRAGFTTPVALGADPNGDLLGLDINRVIRFGETRSGRGCDATDPRLAGVRLSGRRLRRALTLRYRLSERARVTVHWTQLSHGRRISRGRTKFSSAPGARRRHLTARVGRRLLPTSRYILAISAADKAGNRSKTVKLRIRVVGARHG